MQHGRARWVGKGDSSPERTLASDDMAMVTTEPGAASAGRKQHGMVTCKGRCTVSRGKVELS